jgi:LmbE family N-acetylglucosaminyl deacetylase
VFGGGGVPPGFAHHHAGAAGRVRREEFAAAMGAFGLADHGEFLNLPDSGLAQHQDVIAERLAAVVGRRAAGRPDGS